MNSLEKGGLTVESILRILINPPPSVVAQVKRAFERDDPEAVTEIVKTSLLDRPVRWYMAQVPKEMAGVSELERGVRLALSDGNADYLWRFVEIMHEWSKA